jgi:hypothetical protein
MSGNSDVGEKPANAGPSAECVGVAAVSVAPAITNAVYHATGKRILDLPITLDVEDIREVVTLPVAHLDSPHLLP